jgi:hypothetical protein
MTFETTKLLLTTPPRWQKDAKPSARGWLHPRTGEVLVSTRSIDPALYSDKKPVSKPVATKPVVEDKKEEPVVVEEAKSEETAVEASTEESKPKTAKKAK